MYECSGGGKLTWRLSGNQLHCIAGNGKGSSEYSVTVLGEELAYNKSLKQFKMFIVDRPLDPNYKVGCCHVWLLFCGFILPTWNCQEPEGHATVVRDIVGLKDALERKKSYKEHREFLESFQNYREVRKQTVVKSKCVCSWEGGREGGVK